MKNILSLFIIASLIVGFNNVSYSQKNKKEEIVAPDMPINTDSKLITYKEVVTATGTAKDIKAKALKWFHSYYKNSANLLKENTETKFRGHPRFKVLNPKDKKGVATMAGTIIYDITISFKDGKYRYEITNIFKKASTKYPIEKWMNKDAKTYSKAYDYYLLQVDDYMKDVIKSLKEYMAANHEKKADDW